MLICVEKFKDSFNKSMLQKEFEVNPVFSAMPDKLPEVNLTLEAIDKFRYHQVGVDSIIVLTNRIFFN